MIVMFTLAACGGSSDAVTGLASTASTTASTPAVVTGSAATSSPAAVTVADPLLFSASNYSIAQGQGAVTLTVLRVGDASAAVSVDYSTVDGTALAGTDYAAAVGTLQWAENDSTARTISVSIVGAPPFSGSKAFSVALSNPSATAQIATPDTAVVTISGTAVLAAGNLQLSSSAYPVAQTTHDLLVTVNRVSGSSGAVSVQYATTNGTALGGTDFTAASGTLVWVDGDASSKTFAIPISGASSFPGSKSFGVSLSNPTSGAVLGNPSSGTVTISGAASASIGAVDLSAAGYSIAQGAGALTVIVERTNGASGQVTVDYATINGTAIAGTDFTAATGTLTWADGDIAAKTFTVAVSNATPFSGSKTFSVGLSNPGNGVTISSPGNATVTIAGDAAPAVGSLQFSATGYTVAQNAGTMTVSVARSGGASGTVSAAYAVQSGTAVAGVDFTSTNGILQWADGDSTPKTFAIAISNAAPFSGVKSFSLALSSASGGAVLGSPSTAGVSITGDAAAAAGSLQVSSSSYSVVQNAGVLTVTVNRTGGASNAVSTTYATSNGTAIAGTDFTAASGTLNWSNGDATSKTFKVSISNAIPFSGTKSFGIALSSPSGGATLSTPSSASVTIAGDAAATAGTLELSTSSETVAQSAGAASVTVQRTGGSSGAVSVVYGTTVGTATVGTDYIDTRGTLNWSDGDASEKTIFVPISNSTAFAGSKTFTLALANAAGGATIGSPSKITVTISGSGSSSAVAANGPSAPNGLLMTGQTSNSISLSWSAATPGANPVAHYKIYRNGSAYDTSTSTKYTDNGATNATNGAYTSASTIYSYTVSAVDSQGNEGPQTTQTTFNVYINGVFSWAGDFSYGVSINYQDSSGGPESGPYDIAVTATGVNGGFQPYASNVVPLWDFETGSFGYISIDLKPTINGQSWELSMISRLPPGDVYPWALVNIGDYGPAPVAGKWATYKIPLSKLSIGKTSFQGSISGNTLTVTSVNSGVGVDAGGFISGNGVQPGTYITGHNANGGPGTYTVSPSQNVSGTAMTEQRTAVYKFDVIDQSGDSNNLYYIDNVKYTSQ